MLIIPYLYNHVQMNQILIHRFHVLTIGGSILWEEPSSMDVEQEILHTNGIYLQHPPQYLNDHVVLCHVDPEKTTLDDFYKWEEIDPMDRETFCWRTFYTMESNDRGWLTMPCKEKVGPYTCNDLCNMILSHEHVKKVI